MFWAKCTLLVQLHFCCVSTCTRLVYSHFLYISGYVLCIRSSTEVLNICMFRYTIAYLIVVIAICPLVQFNGLRYFSEVELEVQGQRGIRYRLGGPDGVYCTSASIYYPRPNVRG